MVAKRLKLIPEMEGSIARWYARQRGTPSQLEVYRRQARELTDGLAHGSNILEVAPGPGYLAIEITRLGQFRVAGLDVSQTAVAIARENARQARVDVQFEHGDVSTMPFDGSRFDLILCQAAFKNFSEPLRALDEMHRVLRPNGAAVIQDLSKDASYTDIEQEVQTMGLSPFNAFATRFILATMLRRRAYSRADLERLVAKSAFRRGDITKDGINVELHLRKSST